MTFKAAYFCANILVKMVGGVDPEEVSTDTSDLKVESVACVTAKGEEVYLYKQENEKDNSEEEDWDPSDPPPDKLRVKSFGNGARGKHAR